MAIDRERVWVKGKSTARQTGGNNDMSLDASPILDRLLSTCINPNAGSEYAGSNVLVPTLFRLFCWLWFRVRTIESYVVIR